MSTCSVVRHSVLIYHSVESLTEHPMITRQLVMLFDACIFYQMVHNNVHCTFGPNYREDVAGTLLFLFISVLLVLDKINF